MNFKRWLIFTAAVSFSAASGCAKLDDPYPWGAFCPETGTEGALSYILFEDGTRCTPDGLSDICLEAIDQGVFEQSRCPQNATECNTDNNNEYFCSKTAVAACTSVDDCAAQQDGWKDGNCIHGTCVASECQMNYKVSEGKCTFDECPTGQHLKAGSCVADTIIECGSATNNCTKQTAWKDGTCENGTCVASECSLSGYTISEGKCIFNSCGDGKHLNNGSCVEDTILECGSETNDCTKQTAWKSGACENGSCIASECSSSEYTISSGKCVFNSCGEGKYLKNGTCAINTVEACGSETNNCTLLAGWESGTCTNGACKSTACAVGYHLDNNKCIADTNDVCGASKIKCTGTAKPYCSGGVCTLSCSGGTTQCTNGCFDINTSPTNCGSCGNDCNSSANLSTLHAANAYCANKTCKAIKCTTKYHMNSTGVCVVDTNEKCGSETNNCKRLAGWLDGYCIDGSCVVEKCTANYHNKYGDCVVDTNDECGDTGAKCTDTEYCIEGTCKLICPRENIPCSSGCKDIRYSLTDCGTCNNNCLNIENLDTLHATSTYCENGMCKAIKCKTKFHMNSTGTCVADSVSKCGSETNNCTLLAGWESGTCTNGACKSTVCAVGYHLDNNKCVADSNTACGGTDDSHDCTKIANSAFSLCYNGSCIVVTCIPEYHVSSDRTMCIEDTDVQCGEKKVDCTTNVDGRRFCRDGECMD